MSKRYEHPQIVHATGAQYIDPMDAGSLISYKIVSQNYFDACITLTDCNRKIYWQFQPEDIEKIDLAISMFTEFRKELLKAGKTWAKMQEEAAKFNEANKTK